MAQKTIVDFVWKGSDNQIRRVLAIDYLALQVKQYFDKVPESYQRHYAVVNGTHARVYPGVIKGLQTAIDKELQLACATNKPLAFTLALLKNIGLSDYFELVYGGAAFPCKKPNPRQLLAVCSGCAMEPSQVVAIGMPPATRPKPKPYEQEVAGYLTYHTDGYNHGESIQDINSDVIVALLLIATYKILYLILY